MINIKNTGKLAAIFAVIAMLSGCDVEKETVVTVGDAENMLFTDSGRLIVSGGEGIYEVTSSSGIYTKTPLYPEGQCQFTGIAQYGNWLFTVCTEGLLKTAILAAEVKPQTSIYFEKITNLSGFIIANGIAFSPQGDLLIANYNVLSWPQKGITKLPINHQVLANNEGPLPDASLILGELQHKWLPGNPNGVRVSGNKIFTSEGGDLYRHTLDNNGKVTDSFLLTSSKSILDDIYPLCDGAIVTDFLAGNVFYVDANGNKDKNYQTGTLSFIGPSSVTIPQGDMFTGNQLLVTEKGILSDTFSSIGNKVWALDLPFNIREMEANCS